MRRFSNIHQNFRAAVDGNDDHHKSVRKITLLIKLPGVENFTGAMKMPLLELFELAASRDECIADRRANDEQKRKQRPPRVDSPEERC